MAPVAAELYEELSTTEEEPECESREIVKTNKKEEERIEADSKGSRRMLKGKGRQELPQIPSSPPSMESMINEELPGSEDFPGQQYMRLVHKKRQKALAKQVGRRCSSSNSNSRNSVVPQQNLNLLETFQIDPNNNFGVSHVFDEVARGKQVRKQMHACSCEGCDGVCLLFLSAVSLLLFPSLFIPKKMALDFFLVWLVVILYKVLSTSCQRPK
jgi:hypothetical protein